MYILGISAYFHDSAAALLKDGVIIAAMQEERFSRVKHDKSFPLLSIHNCLETSGISIEQVNYIVFFEKPFWKFERIVSSIIDSIPNSFNLFTTALPLWLTRRLNIKFEIQQKLGIKKEILFADHHMAHAASAYYNSRFDQAAVLILDGVGEFATTSIGIASGIEIKITKQIQFPHSLGLLYSAFTQYCGFKVNSGEYKLMGLAPLGSPKYTSIIYDNLIHVNADGSFQLNMVYFDFSEGKTMINKRFCELFNQHARIPESEITPFYCDIAASIQSVIESIAITLLQITKEMTGLNNIVFAGGVFQNCRMNQILAEQELFENHFFYPIPGDAGAAVGAAFLGYHVFLKNYKRVHQGSTIYLGNNLNTGKKYSSVKDTLEKLAVPYTLIEDNFIKTAQLLSEGKIVAWADGAMEFGARALGHRSILADPRSPDMKNKLNEKIKLRENFRPFAPVILDIYASSFFTMHNANYDSMMVTATALPGTGLIMPSVVHADGSSRIQVLSDQNNPTLYRLLSEFYTITRCPALINTSFNIRGEPIVSSLINCLHTFIYSEIDVLVLDSKYMIIKTFDLEFLKNQISPYAYPLD